MDAPNGHDDIRELLLQDHERLEKLFQLVLAAFAADDREGVATTWTRFDRELLAHMDVEERFLVPALFRVNERAARSILEEHRHFRARLMELGAGIDLHVVQHEAARSFIEELRAHARHEDNILYRWADTSVEEPDRRSLLAALFGSAKAHLSPQGG